jgi:hypothetical protein
MNFVNKPGKQQKRKEKEKAKLASYMQLQTDQERHKPQR